MRAVATVLTDMQDLYQRDIVDPGKQPQLLILVAFLVTFIIVRLITHAIRSRRFSFLHDVSRDGTHIHHLVWGILLLLIAGYLSIALRPSTAREPLAVLFGVGAALTLDEFALWLHLEDVYWAKEGRASVDAVIITAVIFGLVVTGLPFWLHTGELLLRLAGFVA